ncbi:MAG: zf-HC2 domain-containing protein, partial [Anaerolineales bacterium]|nr:zf-HC2 domain-containing protein [Anaerolineales bacterium]
MLHAFLDRALDAEEQTAIDVHLAGCPFCAARLAELEALFARLEDLPDTPLQRPLDGDALDSIRRRAAVPRAYRVAIAVQLALGALVLVLARHWVIDALTGLTSMPLQERLAASVS